MSEFFTWEFIASFAGLTAVTTAITQFIKGAPGLSKFSPQLISYVIAFVLATCAQFFLGTFSVNAVVLNLVNAVVISLGSNGLFDAVDSILSPKETETIEGE